MSERLGSRTAPRYLGIEVEDANWIVEKIDIWCDASVS